MRILIGLLLFPVLALSQSVPGGNVVQGQVLTPSLWNTAMAAKMDYLGTTGTGTAVLSTNGAVSGTSITGATIDNTTVADALNFTDLQASALVGTVPSSSIPGSSVRYSTTTTCTLSSTDGGNVVATTYTGTLATCTIPDINTSGINPNAFQMALFNFDTNEMLLNRTSTTTINQLTSIPFAPGAAAILFADNDNSGSGNYNYNAFITGESVGPQPMYLFHDTAQSGTNITDWGLGTISGTNGQFCLYAMKDGGYSPGFASGGTAAFCATRGISGTTLGVGVTQLTFGNATSNTATSFPGGAVSATTSFKAPMLIASSNIGPCAGQNGQGYLCQPASNQLAAGTGTQLATLVDGNQNFQVYQMLTSQYVSGNSVYPAISVTCTGCTFPTDDSGTALAGVIVTANNPVFTNTGTNGLIVGGTVYLSGTIPTGTGIAANTPYYVINCSGSCAPTATSFELSATSGGTAITPTSGTTGNATVVTKISGVYQHSGGMFAGWFTLPTSATYGTGSYAMTLSWTNNSSTVNPQGYKCLGGDESGSGAQLVQTSHGSKTAVLTKSTAASSGDVMGYQCVGTGGP